MCIFEDHNQKITVLSYFSFLITISCCCVSANVSILLLFKFLVTQQDQEKTLTEKLDHQIWCICRKEENGRMILCDNETCETGWFHFSCVGISRKPRGKWYCEECKP